jgi:hypothetical protein
MSIWYILHLFGIFYGRLVTLGVTLYILPRFGILCQEKSGNPDQDASVKVFRHTHNKKVADGTDFLSRVTRFGEFSTVGQLFTLVTFF